MFSCFAYILLRDQRDYLSLLQHGSHRCDSVVIGAGSRQLIVLMRNSQGASGVLGRPSHRGAELRNENEGVTHKPGTFGFHFVS